MQTILHPIPKVENLFKRLFLQHVHKILNLINTFSFRILQEIVKRQSKIVNQINAICLQTLQEIVNRKSKTVNQHA